MRQVEEVLVVGVGVDRRHQPLLDAERVVEHLGDRRQAVGRARGVGDDVVRCRGRSASSLTPSTTVMSWSLAGAVMITFLAPAVEVLARRRRGR